MKKNIRTVLFILISSFILVSYFFYKYYKFKSFVNIYNDEAVVLADKIESYSINRWENIPNNIKDFNKMVEYLNDVDEVEKILEYGINFKYDESSESLEVYSFGVDKIDDKLSRKLRSKSSYKHLPLNVNNVISEWRFWDVFDTDGRDVLLFKININQDYLCINFVETGLSTESLLIQYARSYVFFKGNQKVTGDLASQLKTQIRPYKYLIYPNPKPSLNDSTEISFVRFKNGNFYNVCTDDVNLEIFDSKLLETLEKNKIDYAIIPIIAKKVYKEVL